MQKVNSKKSDFNNYCLKMLFTNIPELHSLEGLLKEELDWHNSIGPMAHLIYDDVFTPFTLERLNKANPTEADNDLITRVFNLIEELLHHEDFEVRCVAEVSFLEPLLDKIKPMGRLEQYLLPKSLEAARCIAERWYGRNPYTWEQPDIKAKK